MNENTSRREFLCTACSTATLLALGFGLTGCGEDGGIVDDPPGPGDGIDIDGNTITLDLTGNQAKVLANAGSALFISAGQTIAVNAGGTIRAFTNICTHMSCAINEFQNDRLVCPCHGSQFNTSGEVVQGPASQPLTEYAVTRNGNTVTITKA